MSKKDQYVNEILSDYTKCVVLDKADVAVQNLIQAAQDEIIDELNKLIDRWDEGYYYGVMWEKDIAEHESKLESAKQLQEIINKFRKGKEDE